MIFFLSKQRLYKNAETTKRYAYGVQLSTYNIEILNSLNIVLHLNDAESTIRNKLKDLLTD